MLLFAAADVRGVRPARLLVPAALCGGAFEPPPVPAVAAGLRGVLMNV
jgi:hypothetical protein